MKQQLGFMQGRLSPPIDGKIQAFPTDYWQNEFPSANQLGLSLMEWTLDHHNLYENPLLTDNGRTIIKRLCKQYNLTIASVTGDCFMQAPFYKSKNNQNLLIEELRSIIQACGSLGIKYIVFPLVDNGKIESNQQEKSLKSNLLSLQQLLKSHQVKIIFESDLNPQHLLTFIKDYDPTYFGINYDIGNSASLGFDPEEEITTYGHRINNVHIKDRMLHGTTVPLGQGNAQFEKVFSCLKAINYSGNYILQTARATDNNHASVLNKYINMVKKWI